MKHRAILKKAGFVCLILCLTGFAFSVFNFDHYDILIKDAKIIDGTGNPWFYGDLGIKGGVIVAIGNLSGESAANILNAQGLIAAPGFIDMHNHSDYTLGQVSSNANLNFLFQGVTTVVTGNCGDCVSLKVTETKGQWEKQGIGTNVVYLVGLGAIRKAVMGVEPREATEEEIESMKKILRKSMQEGAWGVSTGLEYIPGLYSSTEEVIALTKVVGEFDGVYTSHMRDENDQIVEAVRETVRIGEETGVPVNIGHLKVTGKNNWGLMREVVKEVNQARAKGVNITADQYPYVQSAPFGPIFSFLEIPEDMKPLSDLKKKLRNMYFGGNEGEDLKSKYVAELKRSLSDKVKREKIKKLTVEGLPHNPSAVALWGWHDNTVIVSEKYPQFVGMNFTDIFDRQEGSPFDVVVDFVLNEPDMLYAGGSMSEQDLRHALQQEWVMVSSDGSAFPIREEGEKPRRGHPRNFGSFPRVLKKYVREEKLLTLEEAVRKMSSLPASLLRMKDRGLLLRGYKADIVVFDPDRVSDNATYEDSRRYATGMKYVIVNGKVAIENGNFTDVLAGNLLLRTDDN
ncbi:MAG: D-aminoacylase [Candidatus Aminicenantes bacterium]|nr:D-aminoacylase [Candidatus Aminicenantes bacterium]